MKFFISILFLLLLNSTQVMAMDKNELTDLKWLCGAWRGKASWGQPVDLIISKSNGGRMLATETIFKNAKNFDISSYEHFEIRKNGDTTELEVFPSGQKNLILKAISISSSKVIFENKKHDFPKRWGFELLPDGGLKEFASGNKNKVEIVYKKVK